MDITFVANDTRGGIEPYLALTAEASARGHVVRALAPESDGPRFTAVGARFTPLVGADLGRQAAADGPMRMARMGRLVAEHTRIWAVGALRASEGTDVIVSGIGGRSVASPVAEALGVPFVRAHLQPLDAPSADYPGPLAPWLAGGGRLARRASHALTGAGVGALTRVPERAAREALGLTAGPTPPVPFILYGFSDRVVPVRSDAETQRVATGYWTRGGDESEVDERLRAFLNGTGPVISVGFGSMGGTDADALTATVLDAASRVGARVVLLTGWGALSGSAEDERVITIDQVAHSWLFPRVDVTVHHGGAGTTGAALTAGRPTVLVPFGADQPFWGQRAHVLGVAPAPIPRRRLTAEALERALSIALSDAKMAEAAQRLGTRLSAEHGAQRAIDELEGIMERTR